MTRPFNFSAGPATLPQEVIEQVAAEMPSWHGMGLSVMEMSHRSDEFLSILNDASTLLRDLLSIPKHYFILFTQASPTALNAIIPMNLLGKKERAFMDFVHTGVFSGKAMLEAQKYGNVHVAASSEKNGFTSIPDEKTWQLSSNATYVHLCTNETINGTEFFFVPDTKNIPIVADMTSHLLTAPVDIEKYGLIFAGAQKNMGIAGVSVIIIHHDLLTDDAQPICPSVFDFKRLKEQNSLINTPPVFAIYLCKLMFQWIKKSGGLIQMQKQAFEKSALLYSCLDQSALYHNKVDKTCRSRTNVPFFLKEEALNEPFIQGAIQHGLLNLKGHRTQGGMRASLYNAMPKKGVQRLVEYMKEFERTH